MKRKYSSRDTLTGGTGDIKPQVFTIETGVAGAVDDYVVGTFVLPVPRFGTMKTKATIFEILSIDYYMAIRNNNDNAVVEMCYLTTSTNRTSGETCNLGAIVLDVSLPATIAPVVRTSTLSTNGATSFTFPTHVDMTDGAGNGILIATDRIIIVGGGVGNTLAGNYIAKIKYRMVNVGIAEYVGIVQSQQ